MRTIMETKDLMIGDWVMCREDNNPYKVTQLSTEGDVGLAHFPDTITLYDSCVIEPIPLTAAILKENGFSNDCYQTKSTDNATIEICATPGTSMFIHKDGWTYNLPHQTYVHEIQHAFRVCGLNGLADNFRL